MDLWTTLLDPTHEYLRRVSGRPKLDVLISTYYGQIQTGCMSRDLAVLYNETKLSSAQYAVLEMKGLEFLASLRDLLIH